MKHYIFDLDDTLLLHRNDIHYEWIREDPELLHHLSLCPYPKHIFSNGNKKHVSGILTKMKLDDYFTIVVSRENFGYKPSLHAMNQMNQAVTRYDYAKQTQNLHESPTPEIWFFDDRRENLEAGKIFGWKTVWIHPQASHYESDGIVDYGFQDVKQALSFLNKL